MKNNKKPTDSPVIKEPIIDESVIQLQEDIVEGEEIPEEEPALGLEDEDHDYDLGYYAGDQSKGFVGSYLFGTQYGSKEHTFEDLTGKQEEPETFTTIETKNLILGSDPDVNYDSEGRKDDPYDNDVEGSLKLHVVPNELPYGGIMGTDNIDIMIGDPGELLTEGEGGMMPGPVGNDYLFGGDGDDIIFADALFTNWSFFDGWNEADIIDYIENNHEALAVEKGREGGHDIVDGGLGADIIYAQEGNDIIMYDPNDKFTDGGSGFDILLVDDMNTLDLTKVANVELYVEI